MNSQEQKIAEKIWPEKMVTDPYAKKREDALNWLGDAYLCAKPVNRKAA